MRYSRGTRVILAFLVFVIFAAYSYLQIAGYEELRAPSAPAEAAPAQAAEAPAQEEIPIAAEAQAEAPAAQPEQGIIAAPEQEAQPTAEPAPTVDPNSPYGKALAVNVKCIRKRL